MDELLSIQNLTKYYKSGTVVTKALDGVSFSVAKGEFTAIMGASGSGKSTLLHVIAALDRCSGGSVWVEGQNIATVSERNLSAFRRDKIGFVFQEYNLLDTLTVEENIALPLHLKRMKGEQTREALQRVAEGLGIQHLLPRFPREISGGEKQRAACARAIVTNPTLILADEPTGALDSANAKGLMHTFLQMNQAFAATLLLVTHDAVVGSYAKRVLFLKDGKIWSELYRGGRDQQKMYKEILFVMEALGGEMDVH